MSDTRQSLRLGITPRPNFRDMCAGRGQDDSSPGINYSVNLPCGSNKPNIGSFWEGFRFTLYEEVMRRIRAYEQVSGCKLNASMITLKSKQGRPDYVYYRSITFWCSHCMGPCNRPSQSPSLTFEQRLCPFLAVVIGNEASQSLTLSQIYAQHRHHDHVSSEVKLSVANPRPLPGLAVPADEDTPSSQETKSSRKSSQSKAIKKASKNSRMRHSLATVNRNTNSSIPKTPLRSEKAIRKTSLSASLRSRRKSQSDSTSEPEIRKNMRAGTSQKREDTKGSIPDSLSDVMEEASCHLCNFKSTSKNAFCGHCWLSHKQIVDIFTSW